jgi:hypothetical protein
MGIGGHMLGSRKLARLQRLTGLPIDRAYRRNHQCEGRVVWGGTCHHFVIDYTTGKHRIITGRIIHWASCPKEGNH